MTLDIAIGGSTNTVLHLLVAAQEGEVDFTLADIDRLSRKVPHLFKVVPNTAKYHMEDVHLGEGMIAILGELDRVQLLNRQEKNILSLHVEQMLAQYDVILTQDDAAKQMYAAGPAGIRATQAFSQTCRRLSLDLDRKTGCIRNLAPAYSQDGGLAVLFGNLAADGCIVKTAGVDENCLTFRDLAKMFDSQKETVVSNIER